MKQTTSQSFQKLKGTPIFSNFLNMSSIQLSNIVLGFLTFPVITHLIGLDAYGYYNFAYNFAWVFAILINYGTNQSGVRDIAINSQDLKSVSKVFYTTIAVRLLMFVLFVALILMIGLLDIKYYRFILFAIPIVLSEVFNPLFFFLGIQKLRLYNITNLLSKVLMLLFVIFFIHSKNESVWVNFIMGSTSLLSYVCLLIYGLSKNKIKFYLPKSADQWLLIKQNFSLAMNDVSVQLQQSLMVFAIGRWGTSTELGAYSIADKIIGSIRILIIAISNAIYPKAAQLYHEATPLWYSFMKKIRYAIAGLFLSGSILLFLLAPLAIAIVSGEQNATAVSFLRIMAFVPAVAAWNSFNAIDLLLRNDRMIIFKIAVVLLAISAAASFILVKSNSNQWYGVYTLAIELTALSLYHIFTRKSKDLSTSKA